MRDIKFRAWDMLRKKMAYDVQNEYDTIVGIRFEDGEEPGEDSFGSYLKKQKDNPDYEDSARYVVEQYTGLKDADGKEIYEGDIVMGIYGPEAVYWDDDGGFYPFSTPGYGGYEWDHLSANECAVMGNIHQNPEILEKH